MRATAAILVNLNQPLVLAEVEIPALECGQVLVQVRASGICGTQLNEIAGQKGADRFLPHLLGHEGSGVVLETGPGVTRVRPGEHVVLHWRKGAGIDARPPRYTWGARTVNAGWVTTFNTHAVVSENRLTPYAPDIPFDIAALLGCAVTTGLGLIDHLAHLRLGQSIAVLGCGGVGLNVIQGAALAGADPIIAIDQHDQKLALAREFGATHGLNTRHTELGAAIRALVGARGVDVFVENTGVGKLIEQAYALTGPTGRTILVGVPHHAENVSLHTLPLHHGKVLTGCEGGDSYPTDDIPRYLRLYQRNKLSLARLITHRYPLAEINAALDQTRSGEAGRCLVQMN